MVQRQVLYLGELDDNQRARWIRTIEAFSGEKTQAKQLALFPDDREELSVLACETVRVQLDKIELLRPREWGKLFGAKYDVLLYDLTSTYFESEPPPAGSTSKKRFGYSRDKRSDCVQVVVALVLTPEGFPVAYEIYPGNTRNTATLEAFLDRIEKQYGKFRRTWLMDRGIPTEELLEKMRSRGIDYLVVTPKGHLTHVEKRLLEQPRIQARESVRVKILQPEKDVSLLLAHLGCRFLNNRRPGFMHQDRLVCSADLFTRPLEFTGLAACLPLEL